MDSEDKQVYEEWAQIYWPKIFIEESMNVFKFFNPKQTSEKSKFYLRRKRNMEKKLIQRYNCQWNCTHSSCEMRRQKAFGYYLSLNSQA
jgi:hypothetical protein